LDSTTDGLIPRKKMKKIIQLLKRQKNQMNSKRKIEEEREILQEIEAVHS